MPPKYRPCSAIVTAAIAAAMCIASAEDATPSASGTSAPARSSAFKIGIELPTQVPVPKPVENALTDIGIGYAGFYVSNGPQWEEVPEAEVTAGMTALCERLEIDFSLDCFHRNPSDSSIRAAVEMGSAFRGVKFDEVAHCRLLYPEWSLPNGSGLLGDSSQFRDLEDAYDQTVAGFAKLNEHFRSQGAPCTIAAEVWPTLLHAAAQAGMTPCPKICKEFYSSVSLANGLGAALQYGRDLWVDVDMWYFDLIPGHPKEEIRANLELAYWLGADLVYLEGCGYNLQPAGNMAYPFSLMKQVDANCYQLTEHGEMLKEFCTRYLPTHPRPWSFRDLQPTMAIVRFDDTDVGQKAWGVNRLFGTPKLKPDRDTAAWFGLWNVLTWGRTGSDGITWYKPSKPRPATDPRFNVTITPSYLTDPVSLQHTFFVPLNGAVVFDHLVPYERLKGIPLLFLTGKVVSPETMEAIRRCVDEGAICVAWGPLASANGFPDWRQGVTVSKHGRGQFVLTDDFGSENTVRHYQRFLGAPDEICYRFGEHLVILTRVTDNAVDVRVTRPNMSEH